MANILKIGIKYWWVIAIIALAAFGTHLFSIAQYNETPFAWSGENWKYSGVTDPGFFNNYGMSMPLIDSNNAVNLAAHCTDGHSCSGYLKSDFDMNKYDEITVRYSATSSAYAGTSSGGQGQFNMRIDQTSLAGLGSSATESGGINMPSDSDSNTGIISIKKENGGFTAYDNGFQIARTTSSNPALYFEVSAAGSQKGSGGSVASSIQVQFVKSQIASAPPAFDNIFRQLFNTTTPQPGSTAQPGILQSLLMWIQSIFARVFA